MSAPEVTEKAVDAIRSGRYDLIVLNYANPDMVGHTANLAAAVKAVEVVDASMARLAKAMDEAGGIVLITADHGNCEMMRDPETGGPHTSHTTNPVPLLLVGCPGASIYGWPVGGYRPYVLALMGLAKPARDDWHLVMR